MSRVFREHRDADQVLHLAAQVAVTTSVRNPREDFEINALGTFNVLEAMRQSNIGAPLIYASTNKVYGEMTSVGTVERNGRHDYQAMPTGVSEEHNLDFHSPYGCSKGSADSYPVRDRPCTASTECAASSSRQSCYVAVYRQFGAEDQGWVAWFMIASQLGRPITIYGDGKQVRDILFIDDLLDAYDAAFAHPDQAAGRAFNIGGGVGNVVSLLELLAFIEQRSGTKIRAGSADWRPGDQKVFISDIRRARAELGWSPKISCPEGLGLLYDWIEKNRELFLKLSPSLV